MEVIYLISLTPTDLLHVTGEYVCYDRNIAEIALKKLADRKDMSLEAFEAYAESVFTDKICTALIQSMLVDRGIEEERVSDELIRTVFGSIFSNDGDAEGIVDFNCSFRAPLIGIGAPAENWLTKAASQLKCEIIIPRDSEVANAIGTVSGNINESLEALIRYDFHTQKYIAHLPDRRVMFDELDEAERFVEKELVMCGRDFAEKMGVSKYSTDISKEVIESEGYCTSDRTFIELRMKMAISANAKYIGH